MGSRNYGTDKEIASILRKLEAQGWRIERSGATSHWRCYAPDGVTIVGMSATPGAYTAMKNWKAALRRAGAKI